MNSSPPHSEFQNALGCIYKDDFTYHRLDHRVRAHTTPISGEIVTRGVYIRILICVSCFKNSFRLSKID